MGAVAKCRLIALLLLGGLDPAIGQGTLRFANLVPSQALDGRVLVWDGSLAGPEYVAQLLVADPWTVFHANTWDRWTAVGSPAPFRLDSDGHPTGAFWRSDVLELAGRMPGEEIYAAVAVWNIHTANTWEHAKRLRSWSPSNIFAVTLGDAEAPAYLAGLQPWQFVWEVQLSGYDFVPVPMSPRGRVPWPDYPRGEAQGVVLGEGYAYVADSSGSLQVLDVSDRVRPRLAGGCRTRGPAFGVEVAGGYAFVATSSPGGLEIIDVADPAEPVALGFLATGAYALGIAVSGTYAYLAGERDGIQIVDWSDPTQPKWVGGLATPGLAIGVAVAGPYAYVADYHGGLTILDVSDPTRPRRVSSLATSGFARGVALAGEHVLIADDHSGLQIVRISDPANPELLGGLETLGRAYGVSVRDGRAYVADGTQGLVIIDVSEPADPRRIGAVAATGLAQAVVAGEDRALVANGVSGVQWVDISNGVGPQVLNEVTLRGSVLGLDLSVDYAVLADAHGGLQWLEVSASHSLRHLGHWNTPGPALDVGWWGHQAVVACGEGGLQMIDLEDPFAPRLAGAYRAEGFFAGQIVLANDYACVVNGYALEVFDLSDPNRLSPAGSLSPVEPDILGWPGRLAVTGRLGYLTQGEQGLTVVDLADPRNPRHVGRYAGQQHDLADVAVSGAQVYLLSWSSGFEFENGAELQILDVSDPVQPRWVGGCRAGAGIRLTVAGDYAYVADATGGIWVVDVGDPGNPRCLGKSPAVATPQQIVVAGDLIHVAGEGEGWVILDRGLFLDTVTIEDGWLRVSWDPWPGSRLQSSYDLVDPQWEDWLMGQETNTVLVPMDEPRRFLRLAPER